MAPWMGNLVVTLVFVAAAGGLVHENATKNAHRNPSAYCWLCAIYAGAAGFLAGVIW